jgi:hypothetical protein
MLILEGPSRVWHVRYRLLAFRALRSAAICSARDGSTAEESGRTLGRCQPGSGVFHVEQKHPAHRVAPEVVRYSAQSMSCLSPPPGYTVSVESKTTRPPGARTHEAFSNHSSGRNVARDVATENREAPKSSIRDRTTVALLQPHSLTAVLRNATRLARGSKSVTMQSGLMMEKGMTGNPPPEPTSNTSEFGGAKREMAKLSDR